MKPSVKEVAKKFDLGFDYANLIRFKNEEELKKEYGEEFYSQFVQEFSERWFTILGDGIRDSHESGNGITESISQSIRDTFKSLKTEFEDTGDLHSYWNEGEDIEGNEIPIVPEIPDPQITEYFRPNWRKGDRTFFVQKTDT